VFFSFLVISFLHSAKPDERNNPEFGKNHKGTVIQNFVVALADKKSSKEKPKAEPELKLDAPKLEPKAEESNGISAGPINDLNFGGTLDFRFYFPQRHGPTNQKMSFGHFDIHVAELFLTTNVGDHISVLLEQLLNTSNAEMGVGQDHGFVYAIFSDIPLLPESISLKLGRTRFRYGVDTKLDSAANILKSPVYKDLGWITDKGLELSGYFGPVDFSAGVMNGPETLNPGTGHVEISQNSKPVVARIGVEIADFLQVGVSGFTGRAYPVYSDYDFEMSDMNFNAHLDESKFVYKNRAAADVLFKAGKWQVAGEYSRGTDRDSGTSYDVWSAFGRVDYRVIPQKLSLSLQYEFFDDGRNPTLGANTPDTGVLGAAITYYMTDQSWIRLAHLQDDRGLFRKDDGPGPEYMTAVQTLLAF
jgi:hypothetical protein